MIFAVFYDSRVRKLTCNFLFMAYLRERRLYFKCFYMIFLHVHYMIYPNEKCILVYANI